MESKGLNDNVVNPVLETSFKTNACTRYNPNIFFDILFMVLIVFSLNLIFETSYLKNTNQATVLKKLLKEKEKVKNDVATPVFIDK